VKQVALELASGEFERSTNLQFALSAALRSFLITLAYLIKKFNLKFQK
jgi:hypothetical protein